MASHQQKSHARRTRDQGWLGGKCGLLGWVEFGLVWMGLELVGEREELSWTPHEGIPLDNRQAEIEALGVGRGAWCACAGAWEIEPRFQRFQGFPVAGWQPLA